MNDLRLKNEILHYLSSKYPDEYNDLKGLLRPCIRLKISSLAVVNKSSSKFGGAPFVSSKFAWPQTIDGFPLSFVFQLNIAEITHANFFEPLPKTGMLYFFLLAEDIGTYPDQPRQYRVMFEENFSNGDLYISSSDSSKIRPKQFEEHSIDFIPSYSLPSYQDYEILSLEEEKGIDLSNIIEESNSIFNEMIGLEDNASHQLFGHAQALQGSVAFHWSKNALGLSYPFSNADLKAINSLENKMKLLFQIDLSDSDLDLGIASSGLAYYGINEDYLIQKNFEKSLIVFQNT